MPLPRALGVGPFRRGCDTPPLSGDACCCPPGNGPCLRTPPGAQVLVQLQPGASKADVLSRVAGAQEKRLVSTAGGAELVVVGLPRGLAVAAAAGAFSRVPGVAHSEPNYVMRKVATPNDALFGNTGM